MKKKCIIIIAVVCVAVVAVAGSWHSYTDEDGTSYFDDKGNAWDDKGNTWNYYEIWDEIGIEHWTYAVE